MKQESYGGAKYMATFIDDFSRYTTVCFLKQKSDILKEFIKYKKMAENQTGEKIKILRSDNGKEYINKEFDKYLH